MVEIARVERGTDKPLLIIGNVPWVFLTVSGAVYIDILLPLPTTPEFVIGYIFWVFGWYGTPDPPGNKLPFEVTEFPGEPYPDGVTVVGEYNSALILTSFETGKASFVAQDLRPPVSYSM